MTMARMNATNVTIQHMSVVNVEKVSTKCHRICVLVYRYLTAVSIFFVSWSFMKDLLLVNTCNYNMPICTYEGTCILDREIPPGWWNNLNLGEAYLVPEPKNCSTFPHLKI